jgi:hypothetical protein
MKKNMSKIFMLVLIFMFSLSITSFASGWTKGISRDAWWYDLGNGDYYKNSWQWIDGNQDGIAECYYFDQNGWMYANTTTPDGFTINENGAWTVNGVVQTKINFDNYLDGWKALNYEGKKYWCYYANGIFYTNTTTPDGYTVDSVGRWVVNGIPQEYVERNTNTNSSSNTSVNNNTINTSNQNNQESNNNSFEGTNDEYREALLELVNKYREKNGLNSLEENDYLNEMAQIRAEELSVRFSHIRPEGGSLIGEYGVNGEIAMDTAKKPKEAFLGFKGSKQHNKVMLDREFLTFGSGYYVDGNGKSYWCILFSTHPMPENLRQQ